MAPAKAPLQGKFDVRCDFIFVCFKKSYRISNIQIRITYQIGTTYHSFLNNYCGYISCHLDYVMKKE